MVETVFEPNLDRQEKSFRFRHAKIALKIETSRIYGVIMRRAISSKRYDREDVLVLLTRAGHGLFPAFVCLQDLRIAFFDVSVISFIRNTVACGLSL
jgi:hypothetical protein